MVHKKFRLIGFLFLIVFIAGCVASHLDEAKRQYMLALRSEDFSQYTAALEELNAAIDRDPNAFQAYAIRGRIYVQLGNFEQATQDLEKAKQGSFEGKLQWVPVVINLTYGDIFHGRAVDAIRAGDWERAKSYQDTALQFSTNVITTAFNNLGESSQGDELGITMQDLYIKAQERWAAGKFQMALIAGKRESKERQSELLREGISRLSTVIESYPEATALRYYLADGYRKQALTIEKTNPEESKQLQEKALSQLRVCAEIGLPSSLRQTAAALVHTLSSGAEQELEMKILGTALSQQ